MNIYIYYTTGRNFLPKNIKMLFYVISASLELLKPATRVFFQQKFRCHWGCRNGHPHFYIQETRFLCVESNRLSAVPN